jgi:hypothetical protein
MTSYNKLAEQIILDLSGGNQSKDSQLHQLDVILRLRQVISELVRQDIFNNGKFEGDLDSSFHYIYTAREIAVTWDSAKCECTSTLPLVPLSIPGNRGIKEIVPVKNPTRPFYPVKAGQIGMIADILEEGEVAYWPEKDKIFYHKNITKNYTKVTMKLIVPAPENLGADDNFFLPDDIQSQVIEVTKQRILSRQSNPQDRANDANKSV